MNTIDLSRIVVDSRLFRECTPRLLVVTDGSLHAGPGDFGLDTFVATLAQTTIHGLLPTVTTRARHDGGTDKAFDDVDIGRYDVLFLFGWNGQSDALSPAAWTSIARFMQAGGGVFATGDHDDMGAGMCSSLPRVRSMRRWLANDTPDSSDTTRLTTPGPGSDRRFAFGDQSDEFPQRLYANFQIPSDQLLFVRQFPPFTPSNVRAPHPLVRLPDGSALDVFPDHPHEGECVLPASLSTTFTLDGVSTPEWPASRLFFPEPRAVAMSMSYGNGYDAPSKQAVTPRAFIAIAAYDGQVRGVGRVVTDATWHHYVNINLTLTSADLDAVKCYWANLVRWLMPRTVRRCLIPLVVLDILRKHPVAEEIRIPVDGELALPELLAIGEATAVAFASVGGSAAEDFASDVLGVIAARVRESAEIDPARDDVPVVPDPGVAGRVAVAVLGGMVVAVARRAAAGGLEHTEGQFERDVTTLAGTLVAQVLEAERAELDRAARSLSAVERLLTV